MNFVWLVPLYLLMNKISSRKLIVSAWVSLDGVFDADTMEQWFNPYHSDARGAYIKETIDAADAFVLGRTTYEMLAPYWSAQQNNEMGVAARLNSLPKYVVSSTLQKADWTNSTIINADASQAIARLKQQPGQDMVIMGSASLVQSLMQADLIDEYRFLVQPIIVGTGKRFFKDGMRSPSLKLVNSKTFDLGVVLLTYEPDRSPAG
jgi:dihydrofolate reductase